jgi:hypothetical protein
MRRLVFNLFFILISLSAFAQTSVLSPAGTENDSVRSRVIIIPYNPIFYLSDVDRDLAAANKKDVATIRQDFRQGLDASLYLTLKAEEHDAKSLLRNSGAAIAKELPAIYANLDYHYAQPLTGSENQKPKKEKKNKTPKVVAGPGPGEIGAASHGAAAGDLDNSDIVIFTQDKDKLGYMNVSVKDSTLLPQLAQKFNADYFLFINQFELAIDHNDCIDLANKIYNREIKVHYSVFNAEGKQIKGDKVIAKIPSNEYDVEEIIRKNFPQISRQLADALR